MNERTRAYFDDLAERAIAAEPVPRKIYCEAQPNACHTNCETFVQRFPGFEVVRGWQVLGGCWFIPHSVVRAASGTMIDITPEAGNSAIPFVEHRGTELEFAILRQGRDGGWLYPPLTLETGNFGCTESTQPNQTVI